MNPNFISLDVCVVYDRPVKTENIWVYTQASVRKNFYYYILLFEMYSLFLVLLSKRISY